MNLARLLAVPMYRAFDIDAEGRVLAGSDASGSVQLTEIQPNGDMVTLTALPGARWGRYLADPGERAIIVVHDEGGNERYQLSLLKLPRDGEPATLDDLEPVVRDPRFIHSLADIRPGKVCYLTNRRNGVDFDPVIRDLATGAEQTVNVGDWLIHEAVLSPDGRWLAVNVALPTVTHSTQLLLADLTAPEGQHITEVSPAGDLALNNRPRWLPGSDALVFSSNTGREFTGLARYDLAAGERTWLVTGDDADLLGWLSPDGSRIFVERNDDGASRLSVHDAKTGAKIRDVPLPVTGSVSDIRWPDPRWSPDSRTLALSVSSVAMPNDVLTADAATGAVRQLTHSARAWGDERPAVPEPHKIPTRDGELVPCLVYRPSQETDPALAGSAVLVIHGGPEAQSKRDYNPYIQAIASAGHTVVVPNVRGSTGYGKRWYSADDGRRRLDAVADLTAIHAYLPSLGVDPARAALWGGSYGGYMVLAGLAFQPELWAAGVDIVGISSLVTFLENTSPYRRAYREREYGSLARDREFLHAASPLTRIDQIRAPLFIIHGANDPRVPLSEAEQIHAALTERGQECELLVYGDEGHGLAKRSNREDAMPKAIAFLARHLAC